VGRRLDDGIWKRYDGRCIMEDGRWKRYGGMFEGCAKGIPPGKKLSVSYTEKLNV